MGADAFRDWSAIDGQERRLCWYTRVWYARVMPRGIHVKTRQMKRSIMETRAAMREILANLRESPGATRVLPLSLRCPRHGESLLRITGPLQIGSKRRLLVGCYPQCGRHDIDPAASVGKRKLVKCFSSCSRAMWCESGANFSPASAAFAGNVIVRLGLCA